MDGERIRLRAIEPEDLEWLYTIENDNNLWHVGATNVPYSRFSINQFITQTRHDIYSDKELRLIIETKKTHEPIGVIDLTNFSPQHLRAEIGIVITKNNRCNGYAKEALRILIDYCRNVIFLNQIYAIVSINNLAAIKLFETTGFTRSATIEKWLFDGDNYTDTYLFQFFL